MTARVTILGYRTRKEIAEILEISDRTLYNLLHSEYLKLKIPKRGRLSPIHQRIIFDFCGLSYQ